jgi:flagellar hook assembly protein FlgD
LSVCPNPFNPTVEIEFEVERVCHVNLSIYDTEGRLVTTLLNRTLLPGAHRRVWAGTSSGGEPVSSGVYFCKLTLEGAETTSKLVCIR